MARRRHKYDVGDIVIYNTVNVKIKLKMYIEDSDTYSYLLEGYGWIPENQLSKQEVNCTT